MRRHLPMVGFLVLVSALCYVWLAVTPPVYKRDAGLTDLQVRAKYLRTEAQMLNAMADQIDPPAPTPTK